MLPKLIANPFMFGKVVRGDSFCNRKEEMKSIQQIIKSNNNLIIISPRRYGKTSLVINALEKNRVPFLFIDCLTITDERLLLERMLSAYLERLRKGDITEKLKLLSKTIDLEYSYSLGDSQIKVSSHKGNSLEKLISEVTRDYMLVFDEFQEMDQNIVKRLRSILQLINKSFIFLGSKMHMLLYLFSNQKSPFYNFGSIMHLEKIPDSEWMNFIQKKFTDAEIAISDKDIEEILTISDLIPFYVQYICYYVWQARKDNPNNMIQEVIGSIMKSNSYMYEEIYSKLPNNQKKALQVVAFRKGRIFSDETLKEFEIKSSQGLNKSLKLLEEKGVIERNGEYRFNDPLFKLYLAEIFNQSQSKHTI